MIASLQLNRNCIAVERTLDACIEDQTRVVSKLNEDVENEEQHDKEEDEKKDDEEEH